MNKEAVQRTIDTLRAEPESYDQSMWFHDCGTPACVAGYALYANLYPDEIESLQGDCCSIPVEAERILGLSPEEADRLFMESPYGEGVDPSVDDAIEVLERFRDGGSVKWT